MAAEGEVVYLDLGGITEQDPAARKAAVAAHLRSVMGELEAQIRSKKTPPETVPSAVLGRRLIENGENYDPGKRVYTPGPGFETLIKALAADADAAAEKALR